MTHQTNLTSLQQQADHLEVKGKQLALFVRGTLSELIKADSDAEEQRTSPELLNVSEELNNTIFQSKKLGNGLNDFAHQALESGEAYYAETASDIRAKHLHIDQLLLVAGAALSQCGQPQKAQKHPISLCHIQPSLIDIKGHITNLVHALGELALDVDQEGSGVSITVIGGRL